MPLKINVISAASENFGIGFEGDLPWKLKKELTYFHHKTSTVQVPGKVNAVIMGRKTYFSNPPSTRPFKRRVNIVLSKTRVVDEPGVVTCSSWEEVISHCEILDKAKLLDTVWVAGGQEVYKMALESPYCQRLYLTRIFGKFECDTFFPASSLLNFDLITDPTVESGIQIENGIKYRFEVYEKKRIVDDKKSNSSL